MLLQPLTAAQQAAEIGGLGRSQDLTMPVLRGLKRRAAFCLCTRQLPRVPSFCIRGGRSDPPLIFPWDLYQEVIFPHLPKVQKAHLASKDFACCYPTEVLHAAATGGCLSGDISPLFQGSCMCLWPSWGQTHHWSASH